MNEVAKTIISGIDQYDYSLLSSFATCFASLNVHHKLLFATISIRCINHLNLFSSANLIALLWSFVKLKACPTLFDTARIDTLGGQLIIVAQEKLQDIKEITLINLIQLITALGGAQILHAGLWSKIDEACALSGNIAFIPNFALKLAAPMNSREQGTVIIQ